jgi:hypothetical protein
MATSKRKHPCQPAIWKKLSETEKRWWMMFYRDFLGELKLNAIPGAKLSVVARQAVAHNHACLATWGMRGVVDRVFKSLKGSKK